MADKNETAGGLFDLDDNVTSSYLDNKTKNEDGLYRPKLENAKDKRIGYLATVRFLPNFRKDGTVGPTAVQKDLHYADFKDDNSIVGYYECQKNLSGGKCSLCDMYWALKNSKDPVQQDKAKLINRSTKYYSYVQILEDDQQPELVGKIMIFPFGYKIKEMIRTRKEHPKNPCRVEDLNDGMEFNLHIKEVGGYTNYDSSTFENRGPLKMMNSKGKLAPLPVTEDGKIDAKYHGKVKEFLLSREKELEEYEPKSWDEETTKKVNKILDILSGNYTPTANDVNYNKRETDAEAVFSAPKTDAASDGMDTEPAQAGGSDDDFFDFDEI